MNNHEAKARRLVYWRSFLAPRVAMQWRNFITDYYLRLGASPPASRVLAKPLRSYLMRGLGPRRRLDLLLDHHRWMDASLPTALIEKIHHEKKLSLAFLTGKKGGDYEVVLASSISGATQREGELTIGLTRLCDGLSLSRISFAFAEVAGGRALVIGGMQGPAEGQKRAIIDATRDLHGLRPKDAVLLATRALAKGLAPCELHAVKDANHILYRLQNSAKHSNYDAYWRERGAIAAAPFGFAFAPLEPLATGGKARDAAKLAIVQGVAALLGLRRPASKFADRPSAERQLAPANVR